MTNPAQLGTRILAVSFGLVLCACPADKVEPTTDAAISQGECETQHDCALVYRGCCGGCLPPGRDEVLAVPKSKRDQVQKEQCPPGTTCGQCYVSDPEPLAVLLVPACVEHRCEAVDLREHESSRCDSDTDCEAVGRNCCPPYSEQPIEYVGLHEGADTKLLECSPVPPCVPPQPHATPIAYCAGDGHCAVRRRDTLAREESSECYSPTQNLDRATEADAVGCDCVPLSRELCRTDSTGRRIGLICKDNAHWQVDPVGRPCR